MLPFPAFTSPDRNGSLEGLEPYLQPEQLSVILGKWLRKVCATECLGYSSNDWLGLFLPMRAQGVS